MKVVVADATPLHYLILIEATDVLPQLFEKIYVPAEVRDELSHPSTPAAVKAWMQHAPAWLEVVSSDSRRAEPPELASLGAGEPGAPAFVV